MKIELDFNLGDLVFLKTDPDQKQRMVTKINITPAGVYYNLNCGVEESDNYSIEMTADKDWNMS